MGRRLLIGGADALIALATLLARLLIPEIEGTAAMPPLLALSVLRSVGAGVQTPAVGAVIPDIVPDDALPRYNGLSAAMQATVQLAAPAAAGVLLSFGDLRSVMLVDVATAAAGISLLSLVPIPRPSGKSEASAISEAAEGIRFALSRREVALPLGVYAALTLLSIPGGYLAGLFVSQEFGGAWWSLSAVEGVGDDDDPEGRRLGHARKGVRPGEHHLCRLPSHRHAGDRPRVRPRPAARHHGGDGRAERMSGDHPLPTWFPGLTLVGGTARGD